MAAFKILPIKTIKRVSSILGIKEKSVSNLIKSNRLYAKKISGIWHICNNSLKKFQLSFNTNMFFSSEEVSLELKKNDIEDVFYIFSLTENKYIIKKRNNCKITYNYQRYLPDFTISIKQLLKHNLIEMDPDIIPRVFTKESVFSAIEKLKQKKETEYELAKQKERDLKIFKKQQALLDSKIKKWEEKREEARKKHKPFHIAKPTLLDKEIEAIMQQVVDEENQLEQDIKEKLKKIKKKSRLSRRAKIIKRSPRKK